MTTQKNEELYREVVEGTSDLVTRVDENGKFAYVNHTAEKILGLKPEKCIGLSAFDFIHPEDRTKTLEWFDDCVRRRVKAATIENRQLSRTGEVFHMLWTSNFRYDNSGRVVGINAIARDITRRKQAEEALRESEERFTQIAENAHEWIWEVDANGLYTYSSPVVKTVLGYDPKEIVGKKHFYELFHPGGSEERKKAAFDAFAARQPFQNFENRNLHKNGSVIWLSTIGVPKLNAKGNLLGYRGVDADVTERKRAEEAILRERNMLRRLLEASDRNRKLTAYEIHDGVAQHIAGAKMALEMASEKVGETSGAVADSCKRGFELLDEALSETRRLISGLRPPILDEAGVVAAIEHLVHDPSTPDGSVVDFVFDSNLGRFEPLLENAVFRIVQESVTNARRYSQSDRVQVRLTQENGRIHVEVQDWGVGFDPENLAETSFGIRGIMERAKLLGGQAIIESTPGKGTLVRAEFPLEEDE